MHKIIVEKRSVLGMKVYPVLGSNLVEAMSRPKEPDPVKLISSLFSAEKALIDRVMYQLSEMYGPVDWVSPELLFDRTRYYEKEMGWPLYRRFLSFEELVAPERLVEIKLQTNEIENSYLKDDKRRINVDPGTISLERLVLATGKNYLHRVYLSKGIFADLTLIFKKGGFRPLEWTYRDYSDPKVIEYFDALRKSYLNRLRETKRFD